MSTRILSFPNSIPKNVTVSTSKPSIASNPELVSSKLKVIGNDHPVQHDADGGLFDTVSNIFVVPEKTNINRQ